MDLKKRLAQLDRLHRRPVSSVQGTRQGSPADQAALASAREATLAKLGWRETGSSGGPVWSRNYRDAVPAPGDPLPDMREFFTRTVDPSPACGQILFLDTETTGLAGGTGTIPFLLGVSWWRDGGLATRQYFLPGPGHEPALLQELAGLAAGFQVVVTFNGASFDLPLLKTRARLNRMEDPLSGLVVWDLLVPSRRLYGQRLPDCRQQTLEQAVCGLPRGAGDIDGSRIPQVWFDFLATGQAGLLDRVMTHNRRDMVGMALLFKQVVEAAGLLPDRTTGSRTVKTGGLVWQDAWALGRICERRRDTGSALAFMAAAVSVAPRQGTTGFGDHRFLADMLRILKRGGDWLLVEQVIDHGFAAGVDAPWLHREAAILYEHRLVKLPKALDHALKSGEDPRVRRLRRSLRNSGRDPLT